MQIPHNSIRSLSQRPITLDDDDDEDDTETDVVAQAQAIQLQTQEERGSFKSYSGGTTMKSYDASFAASSGVLMSNTYDASSKKLLRSKSSRRQDESDGRSKSIGNAARKQALASLQGYVTLVAFSGPLNAFADDPPISGSAWSSFWTRTLSIMTLGRRKAQVSPMQRDSGKRTLHQSNRSAIWLVSIHDAGDPADALERRLLMPDVGRVCMKPSYLSVTISHGLLPPRLAWYRSGPSSHGLPSSSS